MSNYLYDPSKDYSHHYSSSSKKPKYSNSLEHKLDSIRIALIILPILAIIIWLGIPIITPHMAHQSHLTPPVLAPENKILVNILTTAALLIVFLFNLIHYLIIKKHLNVPKKQLPHSIHRYYENRRKIYIILGCIFAPILIITASINFFLLQNYNQDIAIYTSIFWLLMAVCLIIVTILRIKRKFNNILY